ncbi:hypothetical protein [Hippea alviniae]|uniref:hypothetical protein n=1 Tax=Hippea alviniae TaxID=1279027 RepID=UPI00042987CD|nr:hypothetical protein [Hippea alviniae]
MFVIFFTYSCKKEATSKQEIDIVKAESDGKFLSVNVRSVGYDGLFLKLDKKHAYFVNFTSSVLYDAVPIGFSAFNPVSKSGVSLGVDGHIRDFDFDGFVLSEESRIIDEDSGFLVYFNVKLPTPLREVEIYPADYSTVKYINFDRYDECKDVYLHLIEKPDVFEKEPKNYTIANLDDFLRVCMSQESKEKGNLVSVFRVDRSLISKVKGEGKFELADFLKRKFFGNRNPKVLSSCNVKVIIVGSNFYRLKSKVKLILNKLTKEQYQTELSSNAFKIGKGVYQLKAFSKRMYGSSRPFKCDGKYIYVVVVLNPAI